MFNIKYEVKASLPKLSWLAVISKDSEQITVICGKKVECRNDFFVAGVWSGDFEKAGFDSSEMFFGTGAKLTDSGIRFVTPSHALERLVLAENSNEITVSNSVPFLMTYNGFDLDRSIDQYEQMMCSMLDGPKKMVGHIPLDKGGELRQFIVSNIEITSDLKIIVEQRKKLNSFVDFTDYYDRMLKSIKAVYGNANSEERKNGFYGTVSTFSSGYDSLAAACVAKEIGCDTVAALSGGKYDKDDGTEAVRQLGYENIIKRDMLSYRNRTGLVDAEFLASGELGTMLQFGVFEDLFKDRLVFFGLRGSYWSKNVDMTDDFEMIGYYNCEADVSITENALRCGYLSVPLPTYGGSVASSVERISNSSEMKQWTLENDYDKPIPRRILETHGVSRESFGQHKYGGGFSFYRDNLNRLSKRMSVEGFKAFMVFRKEHKGIKRSPRRAAHTVKYICLNLPMYINYASVKLKLPFRLKQKPRRYANPGAAADLFFWGVDVTKKRYADALK